MCMYAGNYVCGLWATDHSISKVLLHSGSPLGVPKSQPALAVAGRRPARACVGVQAKWPRLHAAIHAKFVFPVRLCVPARFSAPIQAGMRVLHKLTQADYVRNDIMYTWNDCSRILNRLLVEFGHKHKRMPENITQYAYIYIYIYVYMSRFTKASLSEVSHPAYAPKMSRTITINPLPAQYSQHTARVLFAIQNVVIIRASHLKLTISTAYPLLASHCAWGFQPHLRST
jgi:hypothetical protein